MKIAVIGAGPGGLFAALAAAGQNIEVDLFEKRRVGDGIVCGECIFDSLNIMPRPGRGLLRPVEELVVQGRGLYTFALSKYRPLWMLDRKTWQRDLAKQATARGVRLHENEKIGPDRLTRMKKEFDWVLDASGAPSVTSRLHGFTDEYFREYLLAYQVVLGGDFSALMPRIKFAFFARLPAEFQPAYYWVFPKDERKGECRCRLHGARNIECRETESERTAGGHPAHRKSCRHDRTGAGWRHRDRTDDAATGLRQRDPGG